jgi:hypothetical protein
MKRALSTDTGERQRTVRRILLVLVAAHGLLLAVPGAASAHSTDDWGESEVHPQDNGYGYVGYSLSHVGGVYQYTNMWRTNNYVSLSSYISDTSTDGYCGTAQIRYEIYDNGGWVGHWHYRTMPVHDCSTGTAGGGGVFDGYFYSTYKVRNLSARACHANSSGAIVECESNWHGPI